VALDVVGGTPVLLTGAGETARGEVWLANTGAQAVTLTSATLTVDVPPAAPESGSIPLPEDAVIAVGDFKRLSIQFGMPPFTPGGTYAAHIDVELVPGGVQVIPASFIVVSSPNVALAPHQPIFSGVTAGSTFSTTVIVRNVGNMAVTVGPIPDEPLFEVVADERVLQFGLGGSVEVRPDTAIAPTSEILAFVTTPVPAIPPGGWSELTFDVVVPATVGADLHLRALPRIVNERFTIDLLT
jgi:hypothetical protein